jgi:hypothetical protein
MRSKLDPRYDFASNRTFEDCTCDENTLRFYYCKCGARHAAMTAMANEIIPNLSDDQERAMIELDGAVPQRTTNRVGFGLRHIGLLTGIARSGDNASVLTDLGKVTQAMLLDHHRVLNRIAAR